VRPPPPKEIEMNEMKPIPPPRVTAPPPVSGDAGYRDNTNPDKYLEFEDMSSGVEYNDPVDSLPLMSMRDFQANINASTGEKRETWEAIADVYNKYVGIPAAEAADYIVRDAVSELVYRGIANTPALAAGVYTTLKSIIGSKTRALKNGK
jgi:hypothetical protein